MMAGALLVLAAAARADDFTRTMTAAERTAAGLDKLTPEELARLKAIVERYKSGEVPAVRQAAEERAAKAGRDTEERVAAAGARAPQTEAAESAGKKQPGWLHALVTLKRAEEKPDDAGVLESRLAGDFTGWSGRTLFGLENGQVWQQAGGGEYIGATLRQPNVKIYPAAMGSYWLQVEGLRQRVRVKPYKLE